jgi:Zn-dependent M32 family carboxypeptidase
MYDLLMTCAAIQARARQSAALSAVIHSKCTDPDLQRALSALHPAATAGMTPHALATIREANRMVSVACRLPSSLVRREASLASTGNSAFLHPAPLKIHFPHAFI